MNLFHNPAPASLAKRGITALTDNLGPGEFVDIHRAFINVFRPELEAMLLNGGKKICATKTTDTSSPSLSGK